MVNTWRVKTIKAGEFYGDKSMHTALKDIGVKNKTPAWVIAVYRGSTKILIDTGIHDPKWVKEVLGGDFSQSQEQKLEVALKEGLGWSPENVEVVINTHLHFDHCGNNYLFKNAQFIVQKSEWEAAYNPLPIQASIYLRELFDYRAVNYFNWRFTCGEEEIIAGIKVFPTPGHTIGHQSVLINTEEGVLCVTGDICNRVENLVCSIPPGIVINNELVLDSFKQIRMRAKYIIPGHEPCINNFQTDSFPLAQ